MRVGDKVLMHPSYGDGTHSANLLPAYPGVITCINRRHGWYEVLFTVPGGQFRESYFYGERALAGERPLSPKTETKKKRKKKK